jgi:hypothetical protein
VVQEAVAQIRELQAAKKKRSSKASAATMAEDTKETPALLIISSEGILTVDATSRETINSVVIKAISYSSEVKHNTIQ